MKTKIIIPSYNPTNKIIELVNDLIENELKDIIIVDDGSTDESKKIYKKIPKIVKIIYHDKNMGKGAALKTAIKTLENDDSFITVDSDGQHIIKDILKVKKGLEKNDVVIGARNFNEKNVPFRSKFGNKISSIIYKSLYERDCPDTQSGLRGFSIKYKDLVLNVKGDRFEYEMNVLSELANKNIPVSYVGITTIYENKNKGSNFKVVKDSYKIYKNILNKALLKILLSFILFFVSYKLMKYIGIKKINRIFLATLISNLIYILSNKNILKSPSKIISLYILQIMTSFVIIYRARKIINIFILKIFLDIFLSIIFGVIRGIKR